MNECGIAQAFDPATGAPPPPQQFQAIWDTGATNCVITQKVIDACGLVATGMTQVNHAQGTATTETYLVSIYLPNKVRFPTVRVTKGDLTGADMLIGMDIISLGDFAVTNFNGLTKFSFRYPSELHIDFVVEQNKKNRLASIPKHGPGKRSKGRNRKSR